MGKLTRRKFLGLSFGGMLAAIAAALYPPALAAKEPLPPPLPPEPPEPPAVATWIPEPPPFDASVWSDSIIVLMWTADSLYVTADSGYTWRRWEDLDSAETEDVARKLIEMREAIKTWNC